MMGRRKVKKWEVSCAALLLLVILSACGQPRLAEMAPIPTLQEGDIIGLPTSEDPGQRLQEILAAAGGEQVAGGYGYVEKVDSHLQSLLIDYLTGKDIVLSAQENDIQLVNGNRILVAIHVKEYDSGLVNRLEEIGMHVTATNEGFNVVEGEIPLDEVLLVAFEDKVNAILPIRDYGTDE